MASNSGSSARKSGGSASNRAAAKSKSGAARTTRKTAAARSNARSSRAASSNGAKRSSSARSRSAASSSSPARTSSRSTSNGNGAVDTVKSAAGKAMGPALAVGAAMVGVAGGVVLRGRLRRKTVLGVPLPRSFGMPDLDPKGMAKTVGQASKRFAKTTKTVSKDLGRVGDQAERIGKILD